MNHARFDAVLRGLNDGQMAAVDRIADGWQGPTGNVRLTIVDGPPGTGKTHVASAAAGRWVVDQKRRVVVLSPTHTAGERVHQAMLNVGFERGQVLRLAPGNPNYNEQHGVLHFERVDLLPPNLRRVLQQADVLITTWHGCQRAIGSEWDSSGPSGFLLLVDEVSQVSFAAFLAILKRVRKKRPSGYALLGDPHQLPVIATQEVLATNAALGVLRRHPECSPCRLELQYRMNEAICNTVNEIRRAGFGGNPLRPGTPEVAGRTLDQVAGPYAPSDAALASILDPQAPVVFVDTAPLSPPHPRERSVGTSWEYEAEAQLAVKLGKAVESSYQGSTHDTIALSSPYAAQVALMSRLGASSAITVYKAQGHEWDCVIISLARTVGRTVMDEVHQNIYVALSRARCKLILLLNTTLFGPYRVFGSLLRLVGQAEGVRLVRANPQWVQP
ncbi:MAG: AAA domain-containing protein [Phycisphaerales bacterium]